MGDNHYPPFLEGWGDSKPKCKIKISERKWNNRNNYVRNYSHYPNFFPKIPPSYDDDGAGR